MKRNLRNSLFILLFVGLGFFTFGQDEGKKMGTIRISKPKLAFLSVSPTKMNVLYIGVDNPVTIAVVHPDGISKVSISNGSIEQTNVNGEYIVKISGGNEAILYVYLNEKNGKSTIPLTWKFRVKRVPDPLAYFGNKREGSISKEELINANAVIPKMENFDFDLRFSITEFDLTGNSNGELFTLSTRGNKLSDEMVRMIKNLRIGSKIFFENIRAVGPDNTPRKLSPVIFTIN